MIKKTEFLLIKQRNRIAKKVLSMYVGSSKRMSNHMCKVISFHATADNNDGV